LLKKYNVLKSDHQNIPEKIERSDKVVLGQRSFAPFRWKDVKRCAMNGGIVARVLTLRGRQPDSPVNY
jgi:hypothetical protein